MQGERMRSRVLHKYWFRRLALLRCGGRKWNGRTQVHG
jgi:hypothetical protein